MRYKEEFTLRVLRRRNRVPSKAVDIPSLDVFKTRMNGVLSHFNHASSNLLVVTFLPLSYC